MPLYLVSIAVGLGAGFVAPQFFVTLEPAILPLLAALLFVTFLQVPAAALPAALRDRRFLGVLLAVNFVVVPAVVWLLMRWAPGDPGIRWGMALVLLCPCIDYVIVFTRLAGGDGVRLLGVTPVLLLAQLLLVPLYLRLLGGAGLEVPVTGSLVQTFVLVIVVPLVAAGAVQAGAGPAGSGRTAGRARAAARRVESAGTAAMVPLLMTVLFVVVAAQTPRLDGGLLRWAGPAAIYAGFAAVMVLVGAAVGAAARLPVAQRRAAVFSGVTRNSLVVLPLALALPAGTAAPAATAVVLQTLVELVVMVILVAAVPRVIG